MIKLFDKENKEIKFETALFPDKTSQCWKIERQLEVHTVLWQFESEAEVFQLFQLLKLIPSGYQLVVPFMPFARQDKAISNTTTFARQVLLDILHDQFHVRNIICTDPHSNYGAGNGEKSDLWILDTKLQNQMFSQAINENDIICYPDKGAKSRYGFNHKPVIYFDKVRNQQSGVIESIKLCGENVELRDKKILIVDDLCDGGGTFIQAANVLKQYNPKEINLAITHGIFSNKSGILNLLENGINKIYTTNTYIRSEFVENQIARNMDQVEVFNLNFI